MEATEIYHRVASVEDIPEGEGKVVFAGIKKLALFKIDGELICIQNFCPHAGASLGEGKVKGCVVFCPRHGWGFDLKTGQCKTDPRYDVRHYPVKVEDGEVYVGIPDDGKII